MGENRDMIHSRETEGPVRVGIVDDSRSIRRWLRFVLETDPRMEVVGEAGNGLEARDMLRATKVDVVTLDVDMPGMTGLEFLAQLMAHKPMPVVMLSALTDKGSQEAVEALSLGAVDCIEKPRSALNDEVSQEICDRVWMASQIRVDGKRRTTVQTLRSTSRVKETPWHGGIILLGASTGGVTALEEVLSEIDNLPWPVVIAQHMPENFLRSFSRRLNEQFTRNFYVAEDGHVLQSGQAVIALGKSVSTRLEPDGRGGIVCRLGPPSERAVYRPCVDDLFHSAADNRFNGVAALLTGMGADGASGLNALCKGDFKTYAQDEASSVVFGMPKAAIELGAANHVLPHNEIGKHMATTIGTARKLMRSGA